MHPPLSPEHTFSGKLLELTTMIKNYFIFIVALVICMRYDWADGASMSKTVEYSLPNLVNSPTLPPYKDLIGGGGPSTRAANGVPPPPYCLYPPPAKPAIPAPLPPMASPPAGLPSIAPGISPPGAPPTAGLPSIEPSISPPGGPPPAGLPSIAPGISPPGAPPPAGLPSIAPGISPHGASPPAGSQSIAPGGSPPPPAFMPPVAFPTPPPGQARPGLWCVANPKAASAVVQTAMDYACGSGADCGTAAPGGPCYQPDTLVTHASYAFNSYWQRTKAAGGTCDFAGAAMLVTRDPSYDGCRYVYM